jgi:hypothetical protein
LGHYAPNNAEVFGSFHHGGRPNDGVFDRDETVAYPIFDLISGNLKQKTALQSRFSAQTVPPWVWLIVRRFPVPASGQSHGRILQLHRLACRASQFATPCEVQAISRSAFQSRRAEYSHGNKNKRAEIAWRRNRVAINFRNATESGSMGDAAFRSKLRQVLATGRWA